jgi:hypothetical protein
VGGLRFELRRASRPTGVGARRVCQFHQPPTQASWTVHLSRICGSRHAQPTLAAVVDVGQVLTSQLSTCERSRFAGGSEHMFADPQDKCVDRRAATCGNFLQVSTSCERSCGAKSTGCPQGLPTELHFVAISEETRRSERAFVSPLFRQTLLTTRSSSARDSSFASTVQPWPRRS